MNVLISIKPKYVEKIISKEKTFELRRSIFKKKVNKVIIYSTSPEKKIVGYFKSNDIIKNKPENIWKELSDKLGVDEKDFFDYFENKDEGFALRIEDLEVFKSPIETDKLENFKAPQSFKYLNEEETEIILNTI
jgi:type I restriction enzyme S subunit